MHRALDGMLRRRRSIFQGSVFDPEGRRQTPAGGRRSRAPHGRRAEVQR